MDHVTKKEKKRSREERRKGKEENDKCKENKLRAKKNVILCIDFDRNRPLTPWQVNNKYYNTAGVDE